MEWNVELFIVPYHRSEIAYKVFISTAKKGTKILIFLQRSETKTEGKKHFLPDPNKETRNRDIYAQELVLQWSGFELERQSRRKKSGIEHPSMSHWVNRRKVSFAGQFNGRT